MQRRTFSRIILILALGSLPAIAQEGNGWQFDSLGLNTTSPESDAQQVYDVLLKMLDRWNAHDIEGLEPRSLSLKCGGGIREIS
jgi:hypothetical protein